MIEELKSIKPAQIVGNWKMNMTIIEARAFISTLALIKPAEVTKIGLAVPFTMIAPASETARGSVIAIGAQDISAHLQGAHTGDISSQMIVDAGASFVIIGHSERRLQHHEDDALINKKIHAALSTRLQIILCIGETLEQREKGLTEEVLKNQILVDTKDVSADQFQRIVIAYEPLWAIGSGKTATPDQVQTTHRYIRSLVNSAWSPETAQGLAILYGGSVREDNSAQLLALPDVNGLLVGGASLSVDSFSKIIHAREAEKKIVI